MNTVEVKAQIEVFVEIANDIEKRQMDIGRRLGWHKNRPSDEEALSVLNTIAEDTKNLKEEATAFFVETDERVRNLLNDDFLAIVDFISSTSETIGSWETLDTAPDALGRMRCELFLLMGYVDLVEFMQRGGNIGA